MNTPICDFVENYVQENKIRLHMPGHKGAHILGCEPYDITEIKGADSLYEADGIIRQSEVNAGKLFGCNTFYSTEGSSLSIRAMLYLTVLYGTSMGRKPVIMAGFVVVMIPTVVLYFCTQKLIMSNMRVGGLKG